MTFTDPSRCILSRIPWQCEKLGAHPPPDPLMPAGSVDRDDTPHSRRFRGLSEDKQLLVFRSESHAPGEWGKLSWRWFTDHTTVHRDLLVIV